MRQRVEHLTIGLVRELAYCMTRRPLQFRTRRRGRFVGRIDAAREQRLEPAVDARAVQRALDQRVEAEGREMALVEDDGMTQRDRLGVVRPLVQQIEKET